MKKTAFKAEPPALRDKKFKVKLRKDASFSHSTIVHFEVAYNLIEDKITHMTMEDFRRLVRNNGPIAVSMSNGALLIGHPYDY
jgi:hypothetical protein